jgi:hypothetical protein
MITAIVTGFIYALVLAVSLRRRAPEIRGTCGPLARYAAKDKPDAISWPIEGDPASERNLSL